MSRLRIKQKLADGQTVFGMFLQYVTSPAIVDALPDDGLDFVVANTEHNALDMGDFHGLQYGLRNKGIACLVRVHNREPEDVAKACDTFDGVVVPYVEDVEEVKRLVAAAKYRPLKGEALERVITQGEWPSEKTEAYIRRKCADTLFCPMIESPRSVENLDAICSIPGIDAVFVGPNDLSVSLGIPDEYDHPDFIDAMQRIIDTATKHGVAAGAHFSSMPPALRLIEQGGRFIPFNSDLGLIRSGVAGFLDTLRGQVQAGEETVI